MLKNIIIQQVFTGNRIKNIQKNTLNNLSKLTARVYNLSLMKEN